MSSWLRLVIATVFVQSLPAMIGQQLSKYGNTLQRRYVEGVVSAYEMTADNDGWQYRVRANIVVRRDTNGRYYEEIGWSDFTSNAEQSLNPQSLAMRQTVSLDDPSSYMTVPNLSAVQPFLIGPITDTLTFYSDLLLAIQADLARAGQTAYVPRSTPNSWADGHRVLLGQDAIDFSLKVEAVNPAEHTETLVIQHVPPPALHVQLPAKWMNAQSGQAPYNFVQISKQGDGFMAQVGTERFDVHLIVDTRDGHIVSAEMHNPVSLSMRTCTDRELTQCGQETSKTIVRRVTWRLLAKRDQ